MARSILALAVSTAMVASMSVSHTALTISTADEAVPVHGRSSFYVLGIAAATLLWSAAILLTSSTQIALAGGVLAGGAVGNLAAVALWPSLDGVPDPLLAGAIAFNLADVAVAAGLVLVIVSIAGFALQNRGRLGEPVRLSRTST